MPALAKQPKPDDESAEEVALEILMWLAEKLDLMKRFLALSGIPADEIRAQVGRRSFYAGLFAFVMQHEPTLLAMCADRNIDPNWVRCCYEHFAGESVPWL